MATQPTSRWTAESTPIVIYHNEIALLEKRWECGRRDLDPGYKLGKLM